MDRQEKMLIFALPVWVSVFFATIQIIISLNFSVQVRNSYIEHTVIVLVVILVIIVALYFLLREEATILLDMKVTHPKSKKISQVTFVFNNPQSSECWIEAANGDVPLENAELKVQFRVRVREVNIQRSKEDTNDQEWQEKSKRVAQEIKGSRERMMNSLFEKRVPKQETAVLALEKTQSLIAMNAKDKEYYLILGVYPLTSDELNSSARATLVQRTGIPPDGNRAVMVFAENSASPSSIAYTPGSSFDYDLIIRTRFSASNLKPLQEEIFSVVIPKGFGDIIPVKVSKKDAEYSELSNLFVS